LDVVYPYALAFGCLSLLIFLYRSWMYGWYSTITWGVGTYMVGMMAVILRRRLPMRFVVSLLLGLISVNVLQSLLTMGLAGAGMVGLAVLCILAGLFIGVKTGMGFVAAGVLAASFIGVAIYTGFIGPGTDVDRYVRSPIAWLIQISCVLMFTVPLVIAAHTLRQRMTRYIRELQEMNVRLQAEVSKRRQAEGDSRSSESKYRHILEHATEGIFQLAIDGNLLSVNPAFVRMAGYASPHEMLVGVNDKKGAICENPEDEIRLSRMIQDLDEVENLELQLHTKNARTMWVRMNMRCIYDEDENPLYYEGIAQDITERKLAEIALKESEVKYRSVVENSLVSSYIVQDGFFRFVNTTFSAITGYTCRELIDDMRPSDIVHPEYKKIWQDAMDGVVRGQQGKLELELKIETKDGSAVTVKALAGSTIYNGRIAIFGSFIDITNEKTLEGQLRQAQKMEAIGTLAGGIAHDFNNILTALTGYATLLQLKLGDADPLKYYVDQIFSASHKATSLTQSLLTFGRRQPVSLQPVDVGSIVKGTESLLRRLITEDISLVTNLTAEDIVVMADTTQIDQILFNLVSNARDAMPEGGTLTISTELFAIRKDFIAMNGFGKVGSYALLSVSDTGIGMDTGTRERIFDPFFTTKDLGKGTGLGLSTVYGIVKQHKGYICVSSEPSRGSTFSVYFPVAKRASEQAWAPEADLILNRRSSETVLVADDNPEVRRFVRDLLDHCGYRVIEATDGEDAVSRFMAHDDICLVVLDSVMPKRNGRQAYDAMRAAKPGVKALFMSGYGRETILGKGIKDGEMDFIDKPLVPGAFVRKVEEIIVR
jgi:two-component system, cell cycle sensor histidine kinase and response regulator CckA